MWDLGFDDFIGKPVAYPWLFEVFMISMPILSYWLLARVGRARLGFAA